MAYLRITVTSLSAAVVAFTFVIILQREGYARAEKPSRTELTEFGRGSAHARASLTHSRGGRPRCKYFELERISELVREVCYDEQARAIEEAVRLKQEKTSTRGQVVVYSYPFLVQTGGPPRRPVGGGNRQTTE